MSRPAFLKVFFGREVREVPGITTRICGICPVYQMSSCHALENALALQTTPEIEALRRLLYCGEWIESHALHIYLLHAPDFLGYESGISLAADHKEIVTRGLRIKQIGNRLLELLGGRAIHPVNVAVGGFYRAPAPNQLTSLPIWNGDYRLRSTHCNSSRGSTFPTSTSITSLSRSEQKTNIR